MSSRSVSLSEGEFFHVYNRGTDKRVIFYSKDDYLRFQELLFLCNTNSAINVRDIRKIHENIYEYERGNILVAIGTYCLMPNHFHILATPLVEHGLSTFMNKLGTSYSMYFNKKYNRSGALFQGKFKAEHAVTDEYLKYLYSYIHLNPVKLIDSTWKEEGIKDAAKSFDFAASFQYSSLSDYLNIARPENAILNSALFPPYFQSHTDMENELFEWLTYKEFTP